jgi:nickel-dependent lactate racemase
MYHYFAGYGGGPKILMPGLAGHESISSNHRMTLTQNGDFNNKCRNGNIRNNPVYSDIAEAVKFFPPVLYLGTVLNDKGKIIKAFCGDIITEHKRAARFVDKLYKIKIKEKADVVICSAGGLPKDINLIQSHKSIHNAFSALKKNGVLICLAECMNGIGSKTFMQYFEYKNIADLKKNILKEYSLNAQTALSFWDKLSNAKILLVSNLNKNDVQPLISKGLKIYPKYSDAGKYLNKITRRRSYYIIPASNSLQVQSA